MGSNALLVVWGCDMFADDFEDTAVWDRATLVGGFGAAEAELRVLRATSAGYEAIRLRSRGVTALGRGGRQERVDVLLDDPCVSRRHAHLSVFGDKLTITDVGSSHGTYVNGDRLEVNEPRELHDGDRFTLATERFKVELKHPQLRCVDGLASFRREIELALEHVRRNPAAAFGVLTVLNEVGTHIHALRDRFVGEIRISDVLLAADKELLILVRAFSSSEVLRAAARLTRLARATVDDVSVGLAVHPGSEVTADALIAAARAAADGTRPTELRIGQATILIADPAMRVLYQELLPRIAAADHPVLITGETGVGKELVARRIHELSCRHGKLVPVNCAAIPANLVESEFFGHERGAFTGAMTRKPGHFEEAHLGTLFLDEVADLSPAAQAALLRALDTGEVRRVGALDAQQFDVRVVAATNRDLEVEVGRRLFRRDLYHRLRGSVVQIPPLRSRANEIPVLANHFLRGEARRANVAVPQISDEALDFLKAYAWPGNVRELQQVIRNAALEAASGMVRVDHLVPARTSAPAAEDISRESRPELYGAPAPESGRPSELGRIRRALEKHGGNVTRAASELGMKRTTLQSKLKKLEAQARADLPKVRH